MLWCNLQRLRAGARLDAVLARERLRGWATDGGSMDGQWPGMSQPRLRGRRGMLVGCLQGRRTVGAARETDDCARLQGPVRLQDDTGRYEAAGQAAAAWPRVH